MLVEYSRRAYGWYLYTARSWADVFLHQLKPTDWVALESFAMRPNVEVDFTHNMSEVEQGLIGLVLPTFSEAVIFDALVDTLDRMADVKGKKAVLVLASGEDTFSRHTLERHAGAAEGNRYLHLLCRRRRTIRSAKPICTAETAVAT